MKAQTSVDPADPLKLHESKPLPGGSLLIGAVLITAAIYWGLRKL